VYVVPLAPEIGPQEPPVELQRCHCFVYDVAAGDHVPMPAVSTCPTAAVPEIVGSDVTAGPFWTVTAPSCTVERLPDEETRATPTWSLPFGSAVVAS
jgi:hypothetical protein